MTGDGGLICTGALTAQHNLALYVIELFGSENLARECAKAFLVDPNKYLDNRRQYNYKTSYIIFFSQSEDDMLSIKDAAKGYAAVGAEPRLNILRLLVETGEEGMTISEIGSRLKMAPSTLAHHLRFLVSANMVIQEKQGREVVNTANYEFLEELGNFLLHECCKNAGRQSG